MSLSFHVLMATHVGKMHAIVVLCQLIPAIEKKHLNIMPSPDKIQMQIVQIGSRLRTSKLSVMCSPVIPALLEAGAEGPKAEDQPETCDHIVS